MGYPNLPGLQVTLNDLGLQVAAPPAGPKLTLLGVTSNTGIPLNEPLSVTNLSQAIGSFYAYKAGTEEKYPSELALAVDAAAAAGACQPCCARRQCQPAGDQPRTEPREYSSGHRDRRNAQESGCSARNRR